MKDSLLNAGIGALRARQARAWAEPHSLVSLDTNKGGFFA